MPAPTMMRKLYPFFALIALLNASINAMQGHGMAGKEKTLLTLEQGAEKAAVVKIIAYINTDTPSGETIKKAFEHFNIPLPMQAPLLFGIIKRMLNPTLATVINQGRGPIVNATAKADLIIGQLLPWYLTLAAAPQHAMENALLVMVSLADYASYWPTAASDFIAFMDNEREFIQDFESYLNQLIFMIVFRNNLWSKSNKLDFMNKMYQYLLRQQRLNLSEQVEQAQDTLATALESMQISSSEQPATTPNFSLFGQHTRDLLFDLIDALETDVSPNTMFNATTQIKWEDGSFTYPIFYTVIANNKEAFSIALQAGANVNMINASGISVLAFAVQEDRPLMIPELLKNGAHIAAFVMRNGQRRYIYNALQDAVEDGHIEVVNQLLAYGTAQISDQMLGEALLLAHNTQQAAIVDMLNQEIKRRVYTTVINAVAENNSAEIKRTVRHVPSYIDENLLEQARMKAAEKNTQSAYELLSTYKALSDAVRKSRIDLTARLLEAKEQYIDLEILSHLLEIAQKTGYPPLINAIQHAINNYHQQLAEAFQTPMEE